MKRNLKVLVDKKYDIIIVGAGAFGSCAAWEAASRGLSTALVEKGDFCHATSANHLKMVHGGIRYLQHADIYRVRESCFERAALLRIAPHLVQPIPIVMPTYGHGMLGKEVLAMGLLLYHFITLDRNKGLKDPDRQIPWGRLISREQCLELFPNLNKKGLTGAGIFYDGQFYNPPRLALAFLRSAVSAGAHIANYLEVTSFLKNGNRVSGVKVRDILTGDSFKIYGRIVVNASGPWADPLLGNGIGLRLKPKPEFSRDTGFVVSRRLTGEYALACRIETKDPDAILSREGRHIFLIPWRDYTLVGVWHMVHKKGPEEFAFSERELKAYVDEINVAYPRLEISLAEISVVNAGLTLFGDNEPEATDLSFGKRSLIVDHAKEHGLHGFITIIGVRATTARGTAEKAINLIFKKMGKKVRKSKTPVTPIYGGKIEYFKTFLEDAVRQHRSTISEEVIRSLVHNYGSEYWEVLKYIDEDPIWAETVNGSKVLKAEVIHAIREEMAQKLGDVVFRRTDLGTGAFPSEDAIRTCAYLMKRELNWDDKRIDIEVKEVTSSYPLAFKTCLKKDLQ